MAAVATSTSVPTVSASIQIDWGSLAAQILKSQTNIITAAAGGAVDLVLGQIPFGTILETFIGPQVVTSYVQQGLAVLEGDVAGQVLTASNPLETYAFKAINAFEPELAAELGPKLLVMIQAEIAKLFPAK